MPAMPSLNTIFFIIIFFFCSCKCGLIGLAEVVFANVGASKEVNVC